VITNVCINRIATIVVLVMVYAAGYDTARQEAAQAHHNHPAAHQPLKP
jgi:hypothetical protein